MTNLAQQAIEESLKGNFKRAVELNKQILKLNSNDVEALNRLGCAYLELGETEKARKTYKKALKLDVYNPIIIKNIQKIKELKGSSRINSGINLSVQGLFLTEPGKTKITSLINLPSADNFLHLTPGTPVSLIMKRRSVEVCLPNGHENGKVCYLGTLTDDLAFKILRLYKAGNRYDAFIKSISRNNLIVFIREIFRSRKFKDQPSFPEPVIGENQYSQAQ